MSGVFHFYVKFEMPGEKLDHEHDGWRVFYFAIMESISVKYMCICILVIIDQRIKQTVTVLKTLKRSIYVILVNTGLKLGKSLKALHH